MSDITIQEVSQEARFLSRYLKVRYDTTIDQKYKYLDQIDSLEYHIIMATRAKSESEKCEHLKNAQTLIHDLKYETSLLYRIKMKVAKLFL